MGRGYSYDYDLEVIRAKDRHLRTLAMVKRLECNGLHPDRMDAFEIFGEPSPIEENTFLFYGEEKDDSLIRQGGRHAMFTIDGADGYYDFEKILRNLESEALKNDWLRSLKASEREIVLDHILRKVTFISSTAL